MLAAALALASCATARFQALASVQLHCPAGDIDVNKRGPNQWIADGCGKVTVYARECPKCPWLPQGDGEYSTLTVKDR
jgi:hypothetical protein